MSKYSFLFSFTFFNLLKDYSWVMGHTKTGGKLDLVCGPQFPVLALDSGLFKGKLYIFLYISAPHTHLHALVHFSANNDWTAVVYGINAQVRNYLKYGSF